MKEEKKIIKMAKEVSELIEHHDVEQAKHKAFYLVGFIIGSNEGKDE